jgi:hypothetical protein
LHGGQSRRRGPDAKRIAPFAAEPDVDRTGWDTIPMFETLHIVTSSDLPLDDRALENREQARYQRFPDNPVGL